MYRNISERASFMMLRTVILYVLLLASLEVQRSSSESSPFDNPFWVEWLREQRRSGSSNAATVDNLGTMQPPASNSHIFGESSVETVPFLQPLMPPSKAKIIENGKVISTPLRNQINEGYINEQNTDGQSLISKRRRKVSPLINDKSTSISHSMRINNLIQNSADARNNIFKHQNYEENINGEPYLEENRSSLNNLPINIFNSNGFAFPTKSNLQPSLHPRISNKNEDSQLFVVRDDIPIEDKLTYNLITSTIEPIIRTTGNELKQDKINNQDKIDSIQLQRDQKRTGLMFAEGDAKPHNDPFLNIASFLTLTAGPTSRQATTTTTTAATSTTTETSTYRTTTRTLVASWPEIRSRNKGATRTANRFRSRVPLSSSRKLERRVKVKPKRRQIFKRRRQTIAPQTKSTTPPMPYTLSSLPLIIETFDTINTRVSRTPSTSTTTINTTTTSLKTTTSSSTTTSTSTTTPPTQEPSTSTMATPAVESTTSAATFVYTNLRTASALVVTRNVTSTRVVTAPVPAFVEVEKETTFATTTEMTSTDGNEFSTTDSTIIKEDALEEDEQYSHIATKDDIDSTTINIKYANLENTITQEDIVDYEQINEDEKFISMPSNINNVKVEDPGIRSPRLTDEDWQPPQPSEEIESILSGQYHETNPGQYYEMNPGQYYETNPGQYHELSPGHPVPLPEGREILSGGYHEVNPGQYHEVNPGQYHELNPGQYISDTTSNISDNSSEHKVEVIGVEQTDDAQIYNVQQRVNEFIIGEYGTISNSGQVSQGVRYTAVADDQSGVDPNLIYETLVKYFPMAAARFAETNNKAAS